MKMENSWVWIIAIIVVVIATVTITKTLVLQDYLMECAGKISYGECKDKCDMYQLCNIDMLNESLGINGINYAGEFYCVWTKGRTTEEIASTETHELCHELIKRDYTHFCGRT